MKYLKIFGLAAFAAVASMSFGAIPSSATVLCTTTSTPCTSVLGVGSTVDGNLQVGSDLVLKAAFSEIKCKKSSFKGEISKSGEHEVRGKMTSYTLEECKCGERTAHVTTLKRGELSITHVTGTDDGTVTSYNQEFTINCTGLSQCIFGTAAAGTHLGMLTGSHPAVLDENATINWNAGDSSSFVCTGFSGTAKRSAEYVIINHTQLYVET